MNIRKRLLIHTAGFNLGLVMRQLIGVGTPRGLVARSASEGWLAALDDFRTWLIREAA